MKNIQTGTIVYLVVSAGRPVLQVGQLIDLMQDGGWDIHVVATPVAATWIDVEALTGLTGHAVHTHQGLPAEDNALPAADAIIVAPATFNLINKWAAGVNDNLALGVLNEALGAGTQIVAAPHVKAALVAHPAFARSLDVLASCGVTLLPADALGPAEPGGPYRWSAVYDALAHVAGANFAEHPGRRRR